MRADEHVDAVDLVEPEPADRPPQMPLVDQRRARLAETLRGERDAARLSEGNTLGQRRAIRSAAQA